MLLFDRRTGPDLGADAPDYPTRDVPGWYRDAKFGVFIHWGLYSVPAWATVHEAGRYVPSELEFTHHQYAEWYANTLRIPDSPTREHHEAAYGIGASYEDFADTWRADAYDPSALATLFAESGARYVIPTAKHHDGFCLWDTATTDFNSVRRGPRRDLIAGLADAARAAGLKYGLYYSGALDWHVSDFPPIRSLTDLFTYRRNDPEFARYCFTQAAELIDRYAPDVLWNDIEWPDAAKTNGPESLAELFEMYYGKVPDGVVNDRWGVPHLDFRTREYRTEDEIQPGVWEATRGLGRSFGYNRAEDARHLVDGTALVHLLVDTVAKNGNLLLNLGLRADGSPPPEQVERLRGLGDWLARNGSAIYATRPWRRHADPVGDPVRYTATPDGTLNVILLDPSRGVLRPASDVPTTGRLSWYGVPATANAAGEIEIPDGLRGEPAAVLTIEGGAA